VTVLVLCRHAEEGNAAQAELLADSLAPIGLDAVYTSPLLRAAWTAEAVASRHGLMPIEVSDLREIEFGDVAGLEFDEFPAELRQALLDSPGTARFPGGESYDELQSRVCAALDDVLAAHRSSTVAVITHAGPIRAALAKWLGIAADASFQLDQRFAAVNVVEWNEGVPLVRLVNGVRP
jgi:broad specificity phosphatase PhoE